MTACRRLAIHCSRFQPLNSRRWGKSHLAVPHAHPKRQRQLRVAEMSRLGSSGVPGTREPQTNGHLNLTRPRLIAMPPQRHEDRQNHRTQLRRHALDQLLFVKRDDPANFLE
jgi:hypothetical protein